MFSPDVPSFDVDLTLPESRRWQHVIAAKAAEGRVLVREAENELRRVPKLLRALFGRIYARTGGRFNGEMSSWAKALGVSPGTATMLNCAYELSHVHVPRLLGCTAGVRWVEGRGLVHVRTLDWPLPSMGGATSVFNFTQGARRFCAVGVPGQVGILSGMVPGGYSVTINWAPPDPRRMPNFHWGPAFFLRQVLQTCDTFQDAVAALQTMRLSTSVFYTVCGINPGEACVIERSHNDQVTRWLDGAAITQANHHVASKFVRNNAMVGAIEGTAFLDDSHVRYSQLLGALEQAAAGADLFCNLDLEPIENSDTVQKMEFCPRTGELKVWKRIGNG